MSKFKNTKSGRPIEAFLWTGDQHQVEDPWWACQAVRDGRIRFRYAGTEKVSLLVRVGNGDGVRIAERGDFIVLENGGAIRPCKPGTFGATYEAVGG